MDNSKKYIIGIGASAGGLEALQKFLSALKPDTGFPYIIVQHLSPDYRSLLGEILGKYTDMPVIQAEEGMTVEPNKVYIIQPGKNMSIKGGKLRLVNQIPKELNLPIDIFFRSLAEEAGSNAVAIVLSGTGSDGTNGVKTVKENEGIVIVQDPETSKFDGMPRSALRTGAVDAQMSPEEIAAELNHISGDAILPVLGQEAYENNAELMKKVYVILKKVSNVNFTHYKQTTILRRMERRMMITHKESLSDYVDYLYESPEEVRILSKEVLIGVTSFFRDPDYFNALKEKAITEILARSAGEDQVRVWVAGCSTGEEAYSIAIMFSEVMEALKNTRKVKIFATDLDPESITAAGRGVYGDNIVDAVSPTRLSKYFIRRNNTYVINRDIRKMIVFSPHNVFQDPPFGRLDMISCRNMLIYFQTVLQNDLFAIFHQALRDGGFLFLGKSEAIGIYTDAFPVIDAAAKIFSHNAEAKIAGAKKVPFMQTKFMDDDMPTDSDAGLRAFERGEKAREPRDVAIENDILEQFMPACVIINEKNELVHTYGDTSNVMHLSLGKYSNNLFDLITDALKIPVSTLLKDSREQNRKTQYCDIKYAGERRNAVLDLTVAPASRNNNASESLFAVVFSENAQRTVDEDAIVYNVDKVSSRRITDLEQELAEKQTKLDQSVSEQETVNEELQAANEELLTANEELQSSNEELQSVNEELYTVNTEYQQKLTELSDLNDDIANFLSSTLTGIIFVDNKLNIRRYTDYVTSEFSVMDHDIGRSLAFISYHFPAVDITEICTNVLKTLIPDEREIATTSDKVFFMRVAPYRSTENKILGCVITLMDITPQKQSQQSLKSTEKRLTIAQQANDAKSSYLSRIAHEIRTPMGALMSLTKTSLKQAADNAPLVSNLERISDIVNYLTAIVTDIATASVSERLANEQADAPFSLRSVLESVSTIIGQRAQEAGLTYELTMDDDFDPTYIGSRTKIQQILINFLNNSVKYTKPGGAVALKAFESDGDDERALVTFIISDTGIGMKPEQLPLLFKRPDGGDEADEKAPSNMGLGLSIAYNHILSLDGEVAVESEVGKGTTFTVSVYLDKNENKQHETEEYGAESHKTYDLTGRNVLIAEDNALNRTILGALLSKENMKYVEAVDGEEAYNKYMDAPDNSFDCILMDMRMPKLDGIRATALIRKSGKSDCKTIPIIGVSANGFADDIRQAQIAGVDAYTTKPIDRDSLLSTMSRFIKAGGERNKKNGYHRGA